MVLGNRFKNLAFFDRRRIPRRQFVQTNQIWASFIGILCAGKLIKGVAFVDAVGEGLILSVTKQLAANIDSPGAICWLDGVKLTWKKNIENLKKSTHMDQNRKRKWEVSYPVLVILTNHVRWDLEKTLRCSMLNSTDFRSTRNVLSLSIPCHLCKHP